MPSIRQNAYPDVLPDFRNLAVMARVLVAMNALALAGAFYATSALAPALERFMYAAAFLEPLLLVELIVLFAAAALLARLPYWLGCLAVVVIATAIAAAYHGVVRAFVGEALPSLPRTLAITVLAAGSLLAYEIALLERYAEIEQLRLGDRLRITWELDAAPSDALLPPMVLQPLLENAVYHGVEPGTGAGDVLVRIERHGDRVYAAIENPY